MKVEISKDQKKHLTDKISLCVEFLKEFIQPHLVSSDKICADAGKFLTLYLTSKELYVIEIRYISLGFDIPIYRTWYLEKSDRKKAKKYLCDVRPELAVEFLKNWETVRNQLTHEVKVKTDTVNKLDTFIDSFTL